MAIKILTADAAADPHRRERLRREARAIVAGCPGRIPHDFRRTAVRNLVRAGVPERVAMQPTGHKARAVFERYNIVSAGDLREAAQRLDPYAAGIADDAGEILPQFGPPGALVAAVGKHYASGRIPVSQPSAPIIASHLCPSLLTCVSVSTQ